LQKRIFYNIIIVLILILIILYLVGVLHVWNNKWIKYRYRRII
jgi:hypothetical protein